MKKTMLLTALLPAFFASTAFSAAPAKQSSTRQFAFIGLGAGYTAAEFPFDSTHRDFRVKGSNAADGAVLNAYAGYGLNISKLFSMSASVQGQDFINVEHRFKSTGANGSHNRLVNYTYGINLFPAINLNKFSKIFFGAGYVRGQFQFKRNAAVTSGNFNRKRSLNGLMLGVGLGAAITKNLGLSLMYQYDDFESTTITAGQRREKFSPNLNIVTLNLNYKFNL